MKGRSATRLVLNGSIWLAQLMVAVPFVAIGVMKLSLPLDRVAKMAPWALEYPRFVRVIGAIDLAGGIGLILPALTRIAPRLTVWAAIGAALLMVCAIAFHLARAEAGVIGVNFVLLILALYVWWGRGKAQPIHPR